MAWKQGLTYFLKIIIAMSVFVFLAHTLLNKIGESANKPRASLQAQNLKIHVIWEKQGVFYFAQNRGEELFSTEAVEPEGEFDAESLFPYEGDSLFLVKSAMDKKVATEFLSHLGEVKFQRIFFASPYDSTLKVFREIEPRFNYAPSPQTLTKWSLFSSMGLSKVFPIHADFIYKDPSGEDLFRGPLSREIKRRNLLVLEPR